MDRLQNVLLVAGIGCFVFSVMLSGLYPYLITDAKEAEATIEEVAQDVSTHFRDLKAAYPVVFDQAFPDSGDALTFEALSKIPENDPRRKTSLAAWRKTYADALQRGRDVYIADACWHCHSQFVRPVANEDIRFGTVSTTRQDNNALQRPVLWGTRRIGPDLTYEGGKRSNDWHVAHFFEPTATSPDSIMPSFAFYFRDGFQVRRRIDPEKADFGGLSPDTSYPFPGLYDSEAEADEAMQRIAATIDPNLASEAERLFVEADLGPSEKLICLIAYLQWLGTWQPPALEENE